MKDITVCIATIPPRAKLLRRALSTVTSQTLQPSAIVVEYDHNHTGAAATKNRALAKVTTSHTAWLDDDDQFLPQHLETLAAVNADVVYSIPQVPAYGGQPDPLGRYGMPFDADELRRRSYIPTTSLFNTGALRYAGGFQVPDGSIYDDWGCYLALLNAGASFVHVPQQTWIWNIEPGLNTSGQGDRW